MTMRTIFASVGIALLFVTATFAQQVKTDYDSWRKLWPKHQRRMSWPPSPPAGPRSNRCAALAARAARAALGCGHARLAAPGLSRARRQARKWSS